MTSSLLLAARLMLVSRARISPSRQLPSQCPLNLSVRGSSAGEDTNRERFFLLSLPHRPCWGAVLLIEPARWINLVTPSPDPGRSHAGGGVLIASVDRYSLVVVRSLAFSFPRSFPFLFFSAPFTAPPFMLLPLSVACPSGDSPRLHCDQRGGSHSIPRFF